LQADGIYTHFTEIKTSTTQLTSLQKSYNWEVIEQEFEDWLLTATVNTSSWESSPALHENRKSQEA
jgi:hypothetical protein